MNSKILALGAALTLGGCAVPEVISAGPSRMEPIIVDEALRVSDGAELPLQVWLPAEPPTAVVLALHGFNDYANFFAAAGAYLTGRGIASYAYDQRGFGRAPNRGLWAGEAALIEDLRAAVRALRRQHPRLPLYLLGESMGGAVAMVALTDSDAPEVDGVILVAPAVWGRETMPWLQTASLWVAAHTLPELKLSGRGLGVRPSDNREMLRALGRDPWIIKETRVDSLYGLVGLMDRALAASGRLPAPALILYGRRDELVPAEPIRKMLERLPAGGSDRYRVAIYEQGYHMLLRDLQAEAAWADIAVWIADDKAPLPSGADRAATATCRVWNLCDKVPVTPEAGMRS
jgi:alpha-beta hydrolase superfamily lysophospholipase